MRIAEIIRSRKRCEGNLNVFMRCQGIIKFWFCVVVRIVTNCVSRNVVSSVNHWRDVSKVVGEKGMTEGVRLKRR